jgi:flagellar M-ring protein FliF
VFKGEEEPASASVALHLHPGQTLSPSQVSGIRQLVAASVEGLRAESVVIVDQHGNALDSAEPSAATKSVAIEQSITSRVRSMLERVVGAGKVWVVTTAVVDDREVSETQEVYDNANPVLRSESRVVEGMDPSVLDGVGGVAGSRGNLPGATPAAATPATPTSTNGRLQETKNYEISRTVRQVKKPDAALSKLYVAVVVDNKPDGTPRTPDEMAQITALARQAAGIDDTRGDKIDVRAIRFVADGDAAEMAPTAAPPSLLPVPMPIAIGAGAGVLVLIALVVIITRKRGSKRRLTKSAPIALPAPVGDLERALDARTRGDVDAPELPESLAPHALAPGKSTRERVLVAVRADVDRAAEVLTAWLSEPPAKPAVQKGAKS